MRHGTDTVRSDCPENSGSASCPASAPNSGSSGSPPQHDCGGDTHLASMVSAQVHADLHPLSISADLGVVAHVGDLLGAQVALDIGHDCFHV
jgi:hypothetical protein